MTDPDTHDSGDEPILIEVPTARVDARITMEDIAARLQGKPGPVADLARRLAQELGPAN
jgi:hypothetical protein